MMKTVRSEERTTGMGATHFEAVLTNGQWCRVSSLPDARYIGREKGFEIYEIDVPDETVTAHFYRSNSGNMEVDASNGLSWLSFSEANRWASEN